jgi:sugar lactone lactonase YvrE
MTLRTDTAELLLDTRCTLGEGVVWDVAHERILFVDIKERRVHAYVPATGAHRSWGVPMMTGWLVPSGEPGTWLAGMQRGVARLRLDEALPDGAPVADADVHWLHRLHEDGSPLRLNDGKADAQGRLWFGTMNDVDEDQPVGRFFRCTTAHDAPVAVDADYRVTNGPTFSLDGRTLFHTDSAARTVYAFDVADDGTLSNKRVWLRVHGAPAENGYPDGMTTDADGHLWIARWGAGCVVQHAPDGTELRRVMTGAPHTTNVAFGGPGLRDLYITSARKNLAADVADATHSGGLYRLRDAGRGRAPNTAAR